MFKASIALRSSPSHCGGSGSRQTGCMRVNLPRTHHLGYSAASAGVVSWWGPIVVRTSMCVTLSADGLQQAEGLEVLVHTRQV